VYEESDGNGNNTSGGAKLKEFVQFLLITPVVKRAYL